MLWLQGGPSRALTRLGIASTKNLGRRHGIVSSNKLGYRHRLLIGILHRMCPPRYKPLSPFIAPLHPEDAQRSLREEKNAEPDGPILYQENSETRWLRNAR